MTVIIPPKIVQPPKNTSERLYSSTSLTCKATGSPTPTILWYKDNKLIDNDNVDQFVLNITELDVKDRGFYHCEAKSFIDGKYQSVNSSTILLNITSKYIYTIFTTKPLLGKH